MAPSTDGLPAPGPRRLAALGVALALIALVGGCGTSPSRQAAADSPAASLADSPIPTTVPAVTEPATALPAPVAPPDPNAVDPVIHLGTIEIPKLHLQVPMDEGITLGTLARGPGHWPGSALPGQVGNVVVAGHRVTHTHPFRDIDELAIGDQVVFATPGGRFVYRVTSSEVVPPTAIHIVDQTTASTATLFACHPPGSAAYRYVVHLALET
ncbi:MAG TPA: class E sortase [Acidimicrobiales bacterium]|jgi:sortase A